MKIWDGSFAIQKNSDKSVCYGPGEEKDVEFAKKAAEIIGIPLYEFNLFRVNST